MSSKVEITLNLLFFFKVLQKWFYTRYGNISNDVCTLTFPIFPVLVYPMLRAHVCAIGISITAMSISSAFIDIDLRQITEGKYNL